MRLPPREQVVVITGASSGIGRETALAYAEHGARIVLAARGRDALDEAATEVERRGGTPYVVQTDVADPMRVEHLATCAVARFGRIDTWVNNAAVATFGRFEDLALDEIERVLRVDLFGAIYGTRAALSRMQRGSIIIVGSGLGQRAIPLLSMYCTAKHALVGFVDALRVELEQAERDVSVTLIAPSSVDTPFYDHARSPVEVHPIRPAYEPRLVAKAIIHASQHSKRKIDVGGTGVALVAAHHASARLTDRIARIAAGQMLTDEPALRADNLHTPSPGPSRSHGANGGLVFKRSTTTWIEMHPRAALAIAALTLAAARARWFARALGFARGSSRASSDR